MLYKIAISIFCVMTLGNTGARCEVLAIPQKVEIITRDAADYRTPENTLAAIHSALLTGKLEWADEGMTRESLTEEIEDCKKVGIDRSKMFELERNIKEEYIVNKVEYKDAILLVIEASGHDGSFQLAPMPFVLEDGLWKFTNKFASDDILFEYLRYVPPLFDGQEQSPAGANSLLGYEKPTQVQTDLPVGTVNYTVHIYYGKTVVPATFSATLNREDFTAKFAPAAFTDEEVAIPLPRGENVLMLSIEGQNTGGKAETDTDRLVFVVP